MQIEVQLATERLGTVCSQWGKLGIASRCGIHVANSNWIGLCLLESAGEEAAQSESTRQRSMRLEENREDLVHKKLCYLFHGTSK